jgi:hypothetical protein
MKTVVYDIEIAKAIPNRKEPMMPNIKYCNGWHDHKGMGISCIVTYEVEKDSYRVFMKDNFIEFEQLLVEADIVVGFNSVRFDNKVIEANRVYVPGLKEKSFDILREIWTEKGLDPDKFGRSHWGYNLDGLAEANLGTEKSGNGALAPIWFQQGEYGKLIDYCLKDVEITKNLYLKVLRDGFLIMPQKHGYIKLNLSGPDALKNGQSIGEVDGSGYIGDNAAV